MIRWKAHRAMSRAFVNEDAGNDRPDLPERADLPLARTMSPRAGLAALQSAPG
jgi:transcription elongation factor GreB